MHHSIQRYQYKKVLIALSRTVSRADDDNVNTVAMLTMTMESVTCLFELVEDACNGCLSQLCCVAKPSQ